MRGTAGLLGVAVVLLPYSAYFRSQAGYWGLTGATGNVLFLREEASLVGVAGLMGGASLGARF